MARREDTYRAHIDKARDLIRYEAFRPGANKQPPPGEFTGRILRRDRVNESVLRRTEEQVGKVSSKVRKWLRKEIDELRREQNRTTAFNKSNDEKTLPKQTEPLERYDAQVIIERERPDGSIIKGFGYITDVGGLTRAELVDRARESEGEFDSPWYSTEGNNPIASPDVHQYPIVNVKVIDVIQTK